MASLKAIAQRHADWIKMAAYLGSESPEDSVQDMYLKLAGNPNIVSRIDYKGNINTMYIFTVLRSVVVDLQRKKKREHYDELLYDPCKEPLESEQAYEEFMHKVKNTIDGMTD